MRHRHGNVLGFAEEEHATVVTSSHVGTARTVRRLSPSFYWWSRPSRLVVFVLLPIYLSCAYMDETFYSLYGHPAKYLFGDSFVVGLAALLAFALGSACVERGAGAGLPPSTVRRAKARRALAALYLVVLAAYAVLLFPLILQPQILLEHLRGSQETAEDLRLVLNRMPGLTSFVALQSLCIALSLSYGHLTGERLPGVYRVLMLLVVLACALRAWLWSERLALVEVILPAAIAKYAAVRSPQNRMISRLLSLAPLAGLAVMFALFSIGEYFRSWQYYKDYVPSTFLEFSWNRFIGYYATSLANGALAYALHETDFIPFMTAYWFYKMPLLNSMSSSAGEEYDYLDFLTMYLNPEFNTLSGVFMPVLDFGGVLGVILWIFLGIASGLIYRSFAAGHLFGLMLFPPWYVGVAEILRIFYWGDSRFFPVALFGPILVYYLGSSARRAPRRAVQVTLSLALFCCCLMSGTGVARAFESAVQVDCSPFAIRTAPQIINVRSFGARGDGLADDGPAIQDAINSLIKGGVILFPEGTYVHSDVVRVSRDDVVLVGQQAVLLAGNLGRAAIIVEGRGGMVRDLIIRSVRPERRGDKMENAGLLLKGERVAAINNIVEGFTGAGIFVSGAQDFVVACNQVLNTKADGIHITAGATRGSVLHNSVSDSEDDGIGVVAYNIRQQASDVLVESNRIEHIRWGRGISVVGATRVTIRRNIVASIAVAAGILVAREAAWNTPGASNVLIEGNEIRDIQLSLAPLANQPRTGHGAIDLNSDSSDPSLSVRDVKVIDNRIRGSAHYGIRLLGNVCRVAIEGNAIVDVGDRAIAVVRPLCQRALSLCRDNRRDDKPAECERP